MNSKEFFFHLQQFFIEFPLAFWHKHPALFVGFFTLLGTICSYRWHPIYLALLLFIVPFFARRVFPFFFFFAIAACLIAFASSHLRIPRVKLPQEKVHGVGHFHIDNLSILSSPFNRSYFYK